MKFVFAKKCSDCGVEYYTKEISEDHFAELETLSTLQTEYNNNIWRAIIMSLCNNCSAIKTPN